MLNIHGAAVWFFAVAVVVFVIASGFFCDLNPAKLFLEHDPRARGRTGRRTDYLPTGTPSDHTSRSAGRRAPSRLGDIEAVGGLAVSDSGARVDTTGITGVQTRHKQR